MQRLVPSRDTGSQRANSTLGVLALALLSLAFGTALAVEGVPSYLGDPGALFWSSLCMTTGLLLPVALQLRADLRSIMRVENVTMVGLVYWLMLDMLQAAYPFELVNSSDVGMAYVSVGTFAAMVWIGASGRGWRLPGAVAATASRDFGVRTLFIALLTAFALGMSKFVIGAGFDPFLLIEGLGMPRWQAPWSRGQFGGAEAFLDHMQYFAYVVPALTVLLASRSRWTDKRVLLGLLFSIVVLAFLSQGGGRRVIGVVIGAALLTWIAANPRLRPTVLVGGIAGVGAVFFLMQEMLRYRNVGLGAWWAGERPELHVTHLHVDDNFLRLSQLIHFYPDRVDFVYHQPFYHALTLPIPRVLWPGKPLGGGFDPAALVGKEGVALTSSIIGEFWVSLGMAAVVVGGFVIGRLAGMWNKILYLPSGTSRPLLYGLGIMVVFAGLRSVQAMVQMSYIVLAWIVVSHLLARFTARPSQP